MTSAQCRTAWEHRQAVAPTGCQGQCSHCQGQCGCELEFCACGQEISYNNGEWHDECAACREASLTDAAYERGREEGRGV